MTYVIHGATGAQGAPLISSLAAAGASAVAAVRKPEAYVGEAVSADFESEESLIQAYRGAEGVFVHLPMGPPQVVASYARTVVDAVRKAQPARVVVSTSGQVVEASEDSPIAILARGLRESGVSTAVIEPRLYLENLLQPAILEAVRTEGVLRYPLRPEFAASWSSHLDVADAALRLLEDVSVTGTVGVGQLPAITGGDLAAGFASHLGREVRFEAVTPEDFGAALIPLFGEEAAAVVTGFYTALGTVADYRIAEETSAQKYFGLAPRTVTQWLHDVLEGK
ncbi:NAD(P)H-binding protein [Lentzea sp. NPDC051838]|uniref:SDR family oxidoreductase n=1 Tax=Lentzea sp. NPDC051838 TaxID=3154849 RepID=UPI0034271854